MLSVLGHAHATYASNRPAYDRMHLFYQELVLSLGIGIEEITEKLRERITYDDLKKLRQSGLTVEEILGGYPSWDRLVEKNIYDEFYQDISKNKDFYNPEINSPGDLW